MQKDFPHSTLEKRPGVRIACRHTPATRPGLPGVIFCGGFRSDMQGEKASFLESECEKSGQAYVRFDYRGHGLSSDRFEDGCIGDWLEDALEVFDELTEGSQIVVGSSMGGWIALLLALKRKERVAALVGIAPAPDFTEEVYNDVFTDAERKEVEEKGIYYQPTPYGAPHPMTKRLFEDGRKHLLLDKDIPLSCPVRLLHSKLDDAVPWEKSERIRDKLASADVRVTLLEDGDHRLSRPQDLALLGDTVAELTGLLTRRDAARA